MRRPGLRRLAATAALCALFVAGASTANAEGEPSDLGEMIIDSQPQTLSDPAEPPQTGPDLSMEFGNKGCEPGATTCATLEEITGAELDQMRAAVKASDTSVDDAGQVSTTASTRPDGCNDSQLGEGWLSVSRYAACVTSASKWTVYRTVNGASVETGGMGLLWRGWVYTSPTMRTWAHEMEIETVSEWGTAVGTIVDGVEYCSVVAGAAGAACNSDPSSNFPTQKLGVKLPPVKAESYWNFTGTPMSTGQAYFQMYFTAPGYGVDYWHTKALPIRCDYETPNAQAGCVNAYHTPTKNYSASLFPAFAQHVEAAQGTGLAGTPANGPLHRLIDRTKIALNGAKACPPGGDRSWLPRPYLHECDEYPFRSTQEGAYTGGGAARTHSWCQITLRSTGSIGPTGFSICMIPKEQNRKAGDQIAAFYRDNRMLDNDPFYVRIRP